MTSDAAPGYLSADDCRLGDLIDLVSQKTDLADYPYAAAVEQNMLIYDGARLRKELSGPAARLRVEAELARALLDGPGIVVLAGAFDDPWVVDRATRQFEAIIAAQRAAGGATGDHFAAAGQNDRIWNALEKLALRAPEVFADYYANNLIAAVCRAWLGPGYQVTSQVNVVNPGGAAQSAHRDYHLGFASDTQAARFPAHVHRLSPVLTLQGAVGGVAGSDRERDRGVRGRLLVPHQPGPGPGHRRARAAHPGGHPRPGRGGRLVTAATGDRTQCLERPAPDPEAVVSELEGRTQRSAGEI
jgi:phytanoyl-CoA dioxygenase PhyH